ncbi:MAG TPA: hypothetical protein V6C63_14200, partial [Allocoleopsis sp.]
MTLNLWQYRALKSLKTSYESLPLSQRGEALIQKAIALFPDRTGLVGQIAQFIIRDGEEGYQSAKRYLAAQQQVLKEGRQSSSVRLLEIDLSTPPKTVGFVPTLAVLQALAVTPGIKAGEVRSRCQAAGIRCSYGQIAYKLRRLCDRGILSAKKT